mmetsp:Transcript_33467/g.56011  ORF Transcript_33467/g.56011 Transcript_33467/m.56011 type:complete len:203 (+) Transcript_33467:1582-2190(+)
MISLNRPTCHISSFVGRIGTTCGWCGSGSASHIGSRRSSPLFLVRTNPCVIVVPRRRVVSRNTILFGNGKPREIASAKFEDIVSKHLGGTSRKKQINALLSFCSIGSNGICGLRRVSRGGIFSAVGPGSGKAVARRLGIGESPPTTCSGRVRSSYIEGVSGGGCFPPFLSSSWSGGSVETEVDSSQGISKRSDHSSLICRSL